MTRCIELTVNTAPGYPVRIQSSLTQGLGEWVRARLPKVDRVALCTDSHVGPLYASAVKAVLAEAGLSVVELPVVPAGEDSKNPHQLVALLEACAAAGLTRHSALIALGGGMVGDLTGLAASLYMRGIAFIQMPTTLLAAVDASVGGKTAVNLEAGKNLMGAFYQPAGVWMAMETLATLPDVEWKNGWAEVFKTAMIGETSLLDELKQLADEAGLIEQGDYVTHPTFRQALHPKVMDIIAQCVRFKAHVVEVDEKEQGLRAILNFGHTVGHAIEKQSQYALGHGLAVSMGMVGVLRAQVKRQCFAPQALAAFESLLARFGLPLNQPYELDALLPFIAVDKKQSQQGVLFILPTGVGQVQTERMNVEATRAFLALGFSPCTP